ncbi:MAG: tRNA (adenosine(37)-N6)-threonylcarbamoyltransferase complex transferase subunit TsaD [Chloroflexi bacterium]|nr:tRNA (adenosine(37)-N6)-threonylcarbamoyltransferase complex transferase subunit TsaD [Chloroflexota bacterium]
MERSLVLGIETSCDETAAALVREGREVVSNVVSSQITIHQQYGGVVPEIAARHHLANLLPVLDEACAVLDDPWKQIGAIAVTSGPGLAGALLVGVNGAKAIAFARKLPLIGVNHLEAHIYGNWLYDSGTQPGPLPEFPALSLLVSGGHSELILMHRHGHFELLGRTRDDAAGEAFDKVARILGLPYPGGPSLQRAAEGKLGASRPGDPNAFPLPRAQLGESYDFSFSGLKTAAQRLIGSLRASPEEPILPDTLADVAASFQEAVVDALIRQTVRALERFHVRSLLVAGGVAANGRLRELIAYRAHVPVFIPPLHYCTDNGAIIAGTAYFQLSRGVSTGLDLDVSPNLRLAG